MSQTWVRSTAAGDLLESFFVSAIVALISIRFALHLTGYPRIGGATLHIAHMLWGGLLMLVALIMLLASLGRGLRRPAAVIGGIGFGTFIDELGKFITADNDYFFRPAFSLIYVTFVLLYLAFRAIQKPRLTTVERVANALELTLEAARHDLDADEKRRALRLLERAPAEDPLVGAVRSALARIEVAEPARPGFATRARVWLRRSYGALVRHPLFRTVVVAAATSLAAIAVVSTILTAFRFEDQGLDASEIAVLIARFVPAVILLVGVWRLPRSRLAAWHTFHSAVLFQIFVTRVVTFYVAQLGAVLGLVADIIVLSTVRALIQQERGLRAATANEELVDQPASRR